jgi:CRAL/TRIO domain
MVFRSLLIELQRYYPEMLNRCFVLNTPMFFESFWESEIKPHLSPVTVAKVTVTGESSHKDLVEQVDANELPKLYGGVCECEATCVYSDRGPWADVENRINFQNRQFTDMGIMGGQLVEEFKLQECEEDQIDLLNDNRGLADLKNAL